MNLSMSIQDATIAALEDLTDPARRITVEADPARDDSVVSCSNDSLHGKGVCYGPTGDALCLACQIAWIEAEAVAGSMFSIEVAA